MALQSLPLGWARPGSRAAFALRKSEDVLKRKTGRRQSLCRSAALNHYPSTVWRSVMNDGHLSALMSAWVISLVVSAVLFAALAAERVWDPVIYRGALDQALTEDHF
jgi:hypothetical protein